MTCSLLTLFCLVGGVEYAPNMYKVQLLNSLDGVVYDIGLPIKNDKNVRDLYAYPRSQQRTP